MVQKNLCLSKKFDQEKFLTQNQIKTIISYVSHISAHLKDKTVQRLDVISSQEPETELQETPRSLFESAETNPTELESLTAFQKSVLWKYSFPLRPYLKQ